MKGGLVDLSTALRPEPWPSLDLETWKDTYSYEVSSCGFWSGGGAIPYPTFYSNAYDVVRQSESPDQTLLEFFCRPRMKRRRIWWGEIAIRWNVVLIQKARFDPGAALADPPAGCRKRLGMLRETSA
jgi:hypothetical protein